MIQVSSVCLFCYTIRFRIKGFYFFIDVEHTDASGDLNAYNNDNDSIKSSPGVQKKQLSIELNFDAMKRQLAEPTETTKREEREKQIQIVKTFRDSTFDDLMRHTEPKHDLIQNRLADLFNSLATERQITMVDSKQAKEKPIYEHNFPELFFY